MRVNWFSPLPPAKTGIAVLTDSLVPAFRKHAEVTFWTDQAQWDDRLAKEIEVRRFDPQWPPGPELNTADLNFYNIGNNPLFHGSIWQLSRRHSGIVVLHDFCLQDFFANLYLDQWGDPDEYCRLMERVYGEEGRRAALRLCRDGLEVVKEISTLFPLTTLALENALGAVVHHHAEPLALTGQPSFPIVCLPLPVSSRRDLQSAPVLERGAQEPYRLIIFGFLGKNRRLAPFLEAWAGIAEKSAFRLRVCGALENSRPITSRIRELGLGDLVELTGYLSDEALRAELAQADLAVNLRYPTMGEASGSQLKLWEYALPALVTQIGWYASLPPETVAFVRPEQEIEDIRKHLRAFLQNPERFREMGRQGWRTLKRDHTPDTYVRALVDLAAVAPEWGLRSTRLSMARRVGDDMANWVTPAVRDVLSDRVAGTIWDIVGYTDSVLRAHA
jgi:glycosyltransferase involved in cell wall biosynthesis